jgi:predicted permease
VRRLALTRPTAREAARWELEHHVQELADRLEVGGMTRTAAEREARRRLGDEEALRHEMERLAEDTERRGTMTTWIDEVRAALRSLARRPGVAVGGGAMLAAAMTMTLTAWTVVDGVLFRPPPFPEPYAVMEIMAQIGEYGIPSFPTDQAREWIETDLWSAAGLTRRLSVIRSDQGDPEEMTAQAMTPGAFAALGVQAAEGRLFTVDDALDGALPVAVLPEVTARRLRVVGPLLGRSLTLNDQEVQIVGVLPEGVRYPMAFGSDVFLPMTEDGTVLGRAGGRVEIVGRITRDLASSRARAVTLAEGFREANPDALGITLRPVGDRRANPDARRNMLLALGAVGFLFLVALVNAALLFVIHAAGRTDEEAVRLSLGASRGRLRRAWVIRAAVVAALALAVAWAVAAAFVGPVLDALPREIRFMVPDSLGLDGRAAGVAALLGALAWAGLAVLPALTLRWIRPAGAGASGSRRTDSRGAARLRGALVAVQVALSLLLLSMAGVLARSHHALATAELGFDADRVAFLAVTLPSSRYPEPADVWATAERLRERVAALPGVETAALTNGAPASASFSFGVELQPEGRDPIATNDRLLLPQLSVDERALEAFGFQLTAGRDFTRSDEGTDRVIIDEPLARALWPEGSTVGRRFRLSDDAPWIEVIGVVRDVRLFGPDDTNTPFDVIRYASREARPWSTYVIARTTQDPRGLLPGMREAWLEIDRGIPPQDIATARAALAEEIHMERFVAGLLLTLAAATTVVAVLGLYGTVTFSVVRGVRELGIRAALGADARRIRRTVLAAGLRTVGLGMVVGVVAAIASLRLLDIVVYGVPAVDPLALVAATLTLLLAGVVACLVPAARAARTDPAAVLRDG